MQVLGELDQGFKEDLINTIYRLYEQPEECKDLYKIIRRGRVKGKDSGFVSGFILRAYSQLSILIDNSPKPDKSDTANQLDDEPQAGGIAHEQVSVDIPDHAPAQLELEQTKDTPRNSDHETKVIKHPIYDRLLDDLDLSVRTYNCLRRAGIDKVGDLDGFTHEDLLRIKNFGIKSIEELKSELHKLGLDVPFQKDGPSHSEDLSRKSTNALSQATRNTTREDIPVVYDEIYDRDLETELEGWKKSICDLLDQSNLVENPKRVIGQAIQLTFEKYPVIDYKSQELISIKALFDSISGLASSENCSELAKQVFMGNLLKCYRIMVGTEHARAWSESLAKYGSKANALDIYFQRLCGLKYQAIADAQIPKVSRERIRQIISKTDTALLIKSEDLAAEVQRLFFWKKKEERDGHVSLLIETYGRLPHKLDGTAALEKIGLVQKSDYLQTILDSNLRQRLDIYADCDVPIPDGEWDIHYQVICLDRSEVGTGYWKTFEHLASFLRRHAISQGTPELMPKQKSLPRGVGGVIQDFGGQGPVAKKVGLKYQGQLIGEIGRRYWTNERLASLLTETVTFHELEADLMPSQGQIYELMTSGTIAEYNDKKPPSAIAALSQQGKLQWSEVAELFNRRFAIGTSQKAATLSYIKAFVRGLGEHLDQLTPAEIYVLFQSAGINRNDSEKFSRTFDALVDAIQSGVVNKDQITDWANDNKVAAVDELLELGSELKKEASPERREELLLEQRSKTIIAENAEPGQEKQITPADLPALKPQKALEALDKAAAIIETAGSDVDRVEFLKAKATAKLWDQCFKNETDVISALNLFESEVDSYSNEVKQSFLDEYHGSNGLPIPSEYQFKDLKGIPRNPKLMQRLVAYRLKQQDRLLNLSGTGTGKTLSAIFAAQICGAKRIFISCPNGVIQSWERSFLSAFPSCQRMIKVDGWAIPETLEAVTVYIVNHERFQSRYAESLLEFCVRYRPDMIVIDEIHQSKQRYTESSSQRRRLMKEFIQISSNLSEKLRILGLSATPVINNLYEGRSLVELITGESLDEIGETIDLNTCMNLYQRFVRHGIRMNPSNLSRTKQIIQDIDATAYLPQLLALTRRGNYHDVEQILVQPKLNTLVQSLQKGVKTIIFISYIKNTLKPISQWLEANGFSYGVYTGNEKDAVEEGFVDSVEEFIQGSTDILVASIRCIGTGVDGLQMICNRAVFFQLPWTSTEFEQAIGRLDRDGTEFDHVEVFIPRTDVHLPTGKRWSWCQSKLDRIFSKRDIAKAAVDGEVPDATAMIDPRKAAKYWLDWLGRLEASHDEAESREQDLQ